MIMAKPFLPIALLLVLIPAQSFAQGGIFDFGRDETQDHSVFEELESPPTELPPLPKVQGDADGFAGVPDDGYGMAFPQLPPSRLCRKRDLLGLWKLDKVFEVPASQEVADFGEYPYQYMIFNKNSTFRVYKSSYDEKTDAEVLAEIKQPNPNVLEQFVVHKVEGNSVVYLYKDGNAIYNVACFIVANDSDQFEEGQLLFMPPPERAAMRMVKAYSRVGAAPKKEKKKRRRRRRR